MFEAIVVGLGKQGAKHCEAISKIGGRVTCAVDPKLGNKTGRIVAEFDFPVFEKLDDVLESDWSCDVAVICTPVLARKNALLGLISAGVKRFVIEKPLAVSLEEAAWYTQQEQKHGVKIYVNYTYRMSPPFFQARTLGLIDRLELDFGYFYLGGRGSHQLWKHRISDGGGAYNEMAVHMLDLSKYLFGNSLVLQNDHRTTVRYNRNIQGVDAQVDADDVFIASLQSSRATAIIIADFLSPVFSNCVKLTSAEEQLNLAIGKHCSRFSEVFPNYEKYDEFENDSYARMYNLIHTGDCSGLLHTPKDTLDLFGSN